MSSAVTELLQKIAQLLEEQAPKFQIFVALDENEALTLHYAHAMSSVLSDLLQEFRSELKHGDPDAKYKTPRDAVEYWRGRLAELLQERGVPDEIVF